MRLSALAGLLVVLALPARGAEPEPLPPVALASPADAPAISSGARMRVREIRLVGSSVLPTSDVAAALQPFTGRDLGTEELIAARDAITRLYRERGYVTSGAVLPDQTPENGVIELIAIEGALEEIEIAGNEFFRAAHLRRRLRGRPGEPVRIQDLERRLQLLQRDPRIERLDAHLAPGSGRGLSRLQLFVEERNPLHLDVWLANDAAPSLGGIRTSLRAEHGNLTGNADALRIELGRVQGLVDVDARYRVPLTASGLGLELGFERSRSEVVEGPFDPLDVRSELTTYSVELTHPLWRAAAGEWIAGVRGDVRRSGLELLGENFSFLPSQDRGHSRVSALRLFSDWWLRSETQVLALRLQMSAGLDVLDATIYPSSKPGSHVPDGRFVTWSAEAQWARRLDRWIDGAHLVARASLQLANDALLPIERVSVGGDGSVRGYHDNEHVRDNAVVTSLELRVPVLRDTLGRPRLELAPFFDFGKAWNHERTHSLQSIASLGLGVRWRVAERSWLRAYWGGRLRQVDRRDGEGLQDAGFHVELRVAAF